MTIEKRILTEHFAKKAAKKPAVKNAAPQPKPQIKQQAQPCSVKFEAACEEKKEQRYLTELEQVLQAVNTLQCLGFGKHHAQDEKINKLLLSLLSGEQKPTGRVAAELQQVINRRSSRSGISLASGKAFACAKMHELRPLDDEHPHHNRAKFKSVLDLPPVLNPRQPVVPAFI